MSRVRGKKRMEIIKKFIDGEEDPDYEVIPTVTEGKYFVRPRNGSKRLQRGEDSKSKSQKVKQKTEDEQSLDDVDEEKAIEERDPKQKTSKRAHRAIEGQSTEPKHQVVKQSHSNQSFQEFYDPTISYQILEQLKLLGEEQRLKRTKKEQKKLVKHQIQKQLRRKEPEPESSSSEEYDYEVVDEEPKQIFKPTPLRRRVNLSK